MLLVCSATKIEATHEDWQIDQVLAAPDYAKLGIISIAEPAVRPVVNAPIPTGGSEVRKLNATAPMPVSQNLIDERMWTTDKDGLIVCTWMYPFRDPPVIQATVYAPATDLRGFVANPVEGSITATGGQLKVFRLRTQTLGDALLKIVGLKIDLLEPAVAGIRVAVRAKGL